MATKTINLTGAEVAVTGLDGANAHIRNDGTEVIYAAKTAGITTGADGVLGIPAGQAATVYGISGTVYMLGAGSAQIISNDYSELPFKTSTASGGSAVDEQARTAINTHSGNDEIHVTAEDKEAWNAVNYSNPNLLINYDFKINQRGASGTISTHGYFVDCWKLEDGEVTINSGGTLTLNGTISQTLENAVGANVTASASAGTASYDNTTKTFTLTAAGEVIVWAKLEPGSIATPFTPPDPATELLKCQRYFYRLQVRSSGNPLGLVAILAPSDKHYSNSKIFLPVCMRLSPTVTIAGTLKVLDSSNTSLTISDSSVSPLDTNCNIFNLNVRTSTATKDAAVTHELGLNSYIDFSAEL